MNKIALIIPCSYSSIGTRQIFYELLSKGYDVHLIYFCDSSIVENRMPSEKDYDNLIKLLKQINPKILGISSFTGTFDISKKIIRKSRETIDPLILLGGTHAIIEPEECIKYADVVCIWEGDESIPELCTRYFEGKDYSNIPNLWIKKENKIIKNGIESIKDLNNLALPDFSSKNFYYIDNGKIERSEWRLPKLPAEEIGYEILTSRGCPNFCSFCINNIFFKKLGKSFRSFLRKKSIENIIKELKLAIDHFGNQIKFITFYDDIFGLNEKWLEDFSRIYAREIGLPFSCDMHFSIVNEKMLLSLKKAGVHKIAFGLESAKEGFRKEIYNKYISDKQVKDTVELMNKHNIFFSINLIINNPLETDNDLKEGVVFLLSLRPIPRITLSSLTNYPKAELTERLKKEGLIKEADYSLEDYIKRRLTKSQAFKSKRNEYWFYILNFIPKSFIPKSLIMFLTKDIFLKNPRMLLWIFKLGNRAYQIKERIIIRK